MTSVRALLRRAVRPLPAGTQVALRVLRERVAGVHDAAPAVQAVREREQALLEELSVAHALQPGRLRILVSVLQQSPPWLNTACALATALRLRGHAVRALLCDGGPPLCEMNLGGQERPPCEVCSAWLERYTHAFGFDTATSRLSTYSVPGDAAHASTVADMSLRSGAPIEVDGLDLARVARRELQRYRRGFAFDAVADPAYREWIASAVLLHGRAARMLDAERPDVLVVSSGRTLLASVLTAAARARGVRVVSWDTEPSFADGLVFSHGEPAVQVPLDEAWASAKDEPLDAAQHAELRQFLGRWSRSDGTPFPYNPSPDTDAAAIRAALGVRDDARLVAAFANSAWDMAVVDRDAGFPHMFAWLFTLVDYAVAHPSVHLVVRAHPAEVKVPDDLVSRTPVAAEIRTRYPSLPANISLVDGHSPISSYVLAGMADVAMVYSSRFGLELAVEGRRPWLAGDVTYRGKGFTRDLSSAAEMVAALEAGDRTEPLTDEARELACRFAYLWFFRAVARVPRLRPPDDRFALESFRQLAAGADPQVDRLCDALERGASFVTPL